MTTPTRVTEEELAKWEALASAYKAAPKTLIPGKEWSNFVAAFDADAILRLIASHRALEKRGEKAEQDRKLSDAKRGEMYEALIHAGYLLEPDRLSPAEAIRDLHRRAKSAALRQEG